MCIQVDNETFSEMKKHQKQKKRGISAHSLTRFYFRTQMFVMSSVFGSIT